MSEDRTTGEMTFTVYATGYPDEGETLTESQLQERLAAGRLSPGDLVLSDGAWRQLSDVFEMAPFALPDLTDAAEPELALTFRELPGSGLRPQLGGQAGGGRGGLWRRLARRRDGRLRPWWQLGGAALALVACVALAVVYGVIPGMNRLLWRPAYVLVLNPHQRQGGKVHFGDEVHELPPGGSVTVADIFGRMPRTEQVLIEYPNDTWVFKVPLRGGEAVLVNPRGSLWLGVVREQESQSMRLKETDRRAALAEMMAGKPPVKAVELTRRAQEAGTAAVLACTDEGLVYTSDDIVRQGGLNLEQLGLRRSPEDMARGEDGIWLGPSQPGVVSRNLLTGTRLGDVRVAYGKGRREVRECSFEVTFPTPNPKDPKTVFQPATQPGVRKPQELRRLDALTGRATVTVEWRGKQIIVSLAAAKRDSLVVRNQRQLFGQWTYRAVREPNGKWRWSWRYAGQDKIGVARLELEVAGKTVKVLRYEEKRPGK